MATSSSGGKTSAQTKTDTALKDERTQEEGVKTTDEGVAYPESQAPPAKHETPDKVSYRDPRPLDWPQKADRAVYIGAVLSADADDDGSEKKGYVYAGKVREDEELQLGGEEAKDVQVVSGGGQLRVIYNGKPLNFGSLAGPFSAELLKGLEYNVNS